MFRKNRNYYENKDKREKANYDALTPTQRQIHNYINSARLELGGEYVIMQSNGLSIDCYVSTDKLKVEVTSSLIEREIKRSLLSKGLPCPPINVHYV